MTIRDLNRALDWNLPDEEANTVAGLVIHHGPVDPGAGTGLFVPRLSLRGRDPEGKPHHQSCASVR